MRRLDWQLMAHHRLQKWGIAWYLWAVSSLLVNTWFPEKHWHNDEPAYYKHLEGLNWHLKNIVDVHKLYLLTVDIIYIFNNAMYIWRKKNVTQCNNFPPLKNVKFNKGVEHQQLTYDFVSLRGPDKVNSRTLPRFFNYHPNPWPLKWIKFQDFSRIPGPHAWEPCW